MRQQRRVSTWEVPRLALADVDLGDDLGLGVDLAGDLALEVVADELLVGGVEAEAERQRPERHRSRFSSEGSAAGRGRGECGGGRAQDRTAGGGV
jgi:hypothetical protein